MAIARRPRGRRRATAPRNGRVARAGVAGMVPQPDVADMVPRAGVAGMVPVAAIAAATAAVNRAARIPADADWRAGWWGRIYSAAAPHDHAVCEWIRAYENHYLGERFVGPNLFGRGVARLRRVRMNSHLQSTMHDQYVDRPERAVPERARYAADDFEAVFLP